MNIRGTSLTVINYDIYGKHGKKRKPGARDCYQFNYTDGTRGYANRWKLIFCAEHNIDPREISKDYSFRLVNGVVVCETFSERMSEVAKVRKQQAEMKWQEYDYIERFAHECKEFLKGDGDARGRIFCMLNSRRDELIKYGRHAAGGVGLQRATDYADISIMQVFEKVVEGKYGVPSPVASMKYRIKRMIIDNRKHRKYRETLKHTEL